MTLFGPEMRSAFVTDERVLAVLDGQPWMRQFRVVTAAYFKKTAVENLAPVTRVSPRNVRVLTGNDVDALTEAGMLGGLDEAVFVWAGHENMGPVVRVLPNGEPEIIGRFVREAGRLTFKAEVPA